MTTVSPRTVIRAVVVAACCVGLIGAGLAFLQSHTPTEPGWRTAQLRYAAPSQGHYVRWRITPAPSARQAQFRFSWRFPGQSRWNYFGAALWRRDAGVAIKHTWQSFRTRRVGHEFAIESWVGSSSVEFLIASDSAFSLADITGTPDASPALRFTR
ncbi:MAG: hypothetical protein U0271_48030 [Polyangiaceae bacterium]